MTHRNQITIEDVLRSKTGMGDVQRTWRLLAHEIPNRTAVFTQLGFLTLGEVGTQVLIALVGRSILNQATSIPPQINWQFGIVAVLLALLAFLFVRGRQIAQEQIVLTCRARGVERLSHNISRAGYQDLTAVPMAALRELIMTDVNAAYRFFIENIAQTVVVLFWLLASVALMLWLSPLLLVLMAVLGLLFVFGTSYGVRKHMELTDEKFRRLADLSQRAREVVEVERILLSRQFGIGDFFVRMFMRAHAEFVHISLLQGRLAATVRSSIYVLNVLAFLGLICLGGLLITRDALSAGSLIAVLFVVGQLLAAVAQMSDYAGRAAETATAGKRLSAYWDARADAGPAHAAPPAQIDCIAAHGISFGYGNGPLVLDGVDLELARGQLAALTAETGAGKSTLALILAGLLPPTGGQVLINNDPNCDPTQLAPGRLLYVGSKPILLEGSVRDNLFFSDDTSAHSDAELARFFARITRQGAPFPLDEPIIGPNGTGVSSGQAQLIHLARVVLREPDIVLFDEATSSLDMQTEAIVQEELLDWCQRRICLVISHRRCPWTEHAQVHVTL